MADSEPEPLTKVREQFGFSRTSCACAMCRVYCGHVPGRLTPPDLIRMAPAGAAVLAWSEQHLRAATDQPFPKLIPAQRPDGSCHWLDQGLCAVHADAPFGCAFFDAHMTAEQVRERSRAASQSCVDDAAAEGLYTEVWRHLLARGLTSPPPNRAAVDREMRRIRDSERPVEEPGGGVEPG